MTPIATETGDAAAPSRTLRPGELVLLAALSVLALGLRLYALNTPLWYDEIVTVVESVRAPLGRIVTTFAGDNQHPLYSVLAHLSVAAFGESPWALRLPAALLGVATIPVLYLIGRRVADTAEAAAAALVLAVSYHHVWFSQNARGYTAVFLCVLVSTLALLRWLEGRRPLDLCVFALSMGLGAYAHLTTVLVAIGQAAALALAWLGIDRQARRDADWRGAIVMFAASAAVTLLLYAPMLADVSAVMSGGESSGGQQSTLAWTVAALMQGMQVGFGTLWVLLAGGIVFGTGVISYLRRRPIVALLFILPVAVTVATAVILNRPVRPRFIFFSAGFALLFAVRGAAVIGSSLSAALWGPAGRESGRIATIALVALAGVVLSVRSLPYNYSNPKQDYERAVAFVETSMGPNDVAAVIADGGQIPVVKYLNRPWPRVDRAADLEALRPSSGVVWVVSTFPSYIEGGRPDLWRLLNEACSVAVEVDGTVEDGAITVHRCY